MHVLGIDAGGTKTVALLADAEGRIVGEGRAGAANLQTEGELEVEKILHTVIERATDGRQLTPAAVCLGMAGVDRQDDALIIRDVMRRLGFRSNTLIVNDALIALVAGAGASPGVVVISGTGSIAYGVSHHGVAARAGGWGPTLGDEGSGYWIGRRALAAVMRDVDGRGPQTELTRLVLRHFSLPKPEALVAEIYHQPQGRRAIASLGAVVDGARDDGDPVAIDIMSAGGRRAGAGGRVGDFAARDARRTVSDPAGRRHAQGKRRGSSAEVRRRMAEVAPRATGRSADARARRRRRPPGDRRSPRRRARAAIHRRLSIDTASEHRTL